MKKKKETTMLMWSQCSGMSVLVANGKFAPIVGKVG